MSTQAYFKSRGYVPGGILTNSRNQAVRMDQLPAFLRTLLVADGTVTKALEAYFWEPVDVVPLGQAPKQLTAAMPALALEAGAEVLVRRVQLIGAESQRLYAEADSLIRLNGLPEPLRADLLAGRIGIGELLRECGLETYRDILDVGKEDDRVYRTYRIVIQRRPTMLITETFPCAVYR